MLTALHRTTLNTAKVTLFTRKLRQGIRQPLSKTSESKEERAVHKDVRVSGGGCCARDQRRRRIFNAHDVNDRNNLITCNCMVYV
jgi:ribosomal protein S9